MKRDPEYSPERYTGKPFLAVMDQFFLSPVLPPTSEQTMALNITVEKIWGEKGDWREMIIKNMEFGPDILKSVSEMWQNNQKIASENGLTLSPWQFAKMMSDNNVNFDED